MKKNTRFLFLLFLLICMNIRNSEAQSTNASPYCQVDYLDSTSFFPHAITSVNLASLTNGTGSSPYPFPHFIFYNQLQSALLNANTNYTLQVKITNSTRFRAVAAFIDLDNNGLLTDPNETILSEYLAPGDTVVAASFNTGASTPGVHRLRVRVCDDYTFTQSPGSITVDPCYNYPWGETEDYAVGSTGTGLENTTQQTPVLLYPDPAVNVLHLTFDGIIKHITIYSVSGQKMFSSVYDANHAEINVQSLPDGLYIINMESNNKNIKSLFQKIN